MGYVAEGIIDPVIAFVYALDYLPKEYDRHQPNRELMIAGIRENINDVASFHPSIDSDLIRADLSLEEVIRHGIDKLLIEFFVGIRAVRAERGYQVTQQEGIAAKDLTEQRILEVKRQVIADYCSLWTGEKVALTRSTKEPQIREAQALLEFISPLLR